MSRKPFPSLNSFQTFVIDEISRRKVDVPTPAIAPFARLTSPKSDDKGNYKFFTLGLQGWQSQTSIFDINYGQNNIVGYGWGVDGKQTLVSAEIDDTNMAQSSRRPVPGIITVRVDYKGIQSPIIADVVWVCYNSVQLEYLRKHFMAAGSYLVLEIGNKFAETSDTIGRQLKVFDFSKSTAMSELTTMLIKGRDYIIDNYVAPSGGNYNIYICMTANYSILEKEDGSYEVTTRLVSMGNNIFGVTNYATYIDLKKAAEAQSPGRKVLEAAFSTTINDFFKDGGYCDQILNVNNDSYFADNVIHKPLSFPTDQQDAGNTAAKGVAAARGVAVNTANESFITFNFFLQILVPAMLSYLQENTGLVATDIGLLKGINNIPVEPTVGYSPYLLTTNPFTVVILNSAQIVQSTNSYFYGKPFFAAKDTNSASATGRAVLSSGVWLNMRAIKQAFATNHTMFESITALLNMVNVATEEFWHLTLGWDENASCYIIYDDKGYPVPNDIGNFFTLNQGTKSELLGWEFNVNYPDELLAAAIAATNQDVSTTNAVGSPNPISQMLNEGTFKDLLKVSVDRARTSIQPKRPLSLSQLLNAMGGKQSDMVTQILPIGSAAATQQTTPPNAAADSSAALSQQQLAASKGKSNYAEVTQAQDDAQHTYSNSLYPYMEVFPSRMLAHITSTGGFATPTPSLTAPITINVTMQGMGGFSVFDCFYLDKIPLIFRKHGVFAVMGWMDEIEQTGWRTTLTASYLVLKR